MLLEVVDGGEGTLVWQKEASKRGGRFEEEEEEVCNQCQEEERAKGGKGWLATPTGCRLLAQVKPSLKIFQKTCENHSRSFPKMSENQ